MARSKRSRKANKAPSARGGLVNRVTTRVGSTALRRGMRSGSRGWLYLGASMEGLRLVNRLFAQKPEVVRIKLAPGEGIEIREIPRTK